MRAYGGPYSLIDAVADADGVLDVDDCCPGTALPEIAPQLKPNRYRVIESGDFISDAPNAPTYTIADTCGCSASQIADELGLGAGSAGCHLGTSAGTTQLDGTPGFGFGERLQESWT